EEQPVPFHAPQPWACPKTAQIFPGPAGRQPPAGDCSYSPRSLTPISDQPPPGEDTKHGGRPHEPLSGERGGQLSSWPGRGRGRMKAGACADVALRGRGGRERPARSRGPMFRLHVTVRV